MLLTKDGSIQGYNAQAGVDAQAQIIVAHGLTQSMSDQDQRVALVDGIKRTSVVSPGKLPPMLVAAARLNLGALADRRIGASIATGRAKPPPRPNESTAARSPRPCGTS